MSRYAIEIENISKRYRLIDAAAHTKKMSIWDYIFLPYKRFKEIRSLTSFKENDNKNIFWALKNISLQIEHGEVLGIIGKNGAGKSTLLKILSKITAPTTGKAILRGRVNSLLEVGTGFNPELTGRENIYMNGTLHGMSKTEIDKKLDEIIDFAGVEKFVDIPVKRYSSGMGVRLGFAVAAHLEPEILIVDEVLAVGDAEFQKKAIGKMQDVSKGEGRTVLFVSHNMPAVSNLCKNSVLLNDGIIQSMGSSNGIIEEYLALGKTVSQGLARDDTPPPKGKRLKIRQVSIVDKNKAITTELHNAADGFVEIIFEVFEEGKKYNVSFELHHEEHGCIFTSSLYDTRTRNFDKYVFKTGLYKYLIKLPLYMLRAGDYKVVVASAIPNIEFLDIFGYDVKFFVHDFVSTEAILKEGRKGSVYAHLNWEKIS